MQELRMGCTIDTGHHEVYGGVFKSYKKYIFVMIQFVEVRTSAELR